MLSPRNFLLGKRIDKNVEIHDIGDRICMTRDKLSLMYYTKQFIEKTCDMVNSGRKKKLEYPNIRFDFMDCAGKYIPETNTIVMDKDSITVPNILHEFRHYLQFQLKELLYYKGNLSPLPPPFYRFQLHEMCAYDFQHRFEGAEERDINEEINGLLKDAQHLIKIGAFNPVAFHIEHEYYKNYNKLFDQMNMLDEDVETSFPNGKINYFTQNLNNQNVEIAHYNTDRNFFNLKYEVDNHKYEANIEIKGDKCIVYGINICENIMICKKSEYKKACNIAFDFASNISKIYKLNELDINPYSLNIHKSDFRSIINEYKEKHLGINDYLKFNHIPNPTPKEDITKSLIEKLDIGISVKENNFINQDDILENIRTIEKTGNKDLENINHDNDER